MRHLRRTATRTTLTILIGISIAAACGGSGKHGISLTGRWTASGYTCPPDAPHNETFAIVQHGTKIVATKIVGDNCVVAGHESFSGTFTGTTGLVHYWVATRGGTPSLQAGAVTLTMVNANEFKTTFLGSPVYTRLPAKHSGHRWLWLLLLVLLAVIAFALYRAYRRRAGSTKPEVP